MAKSTGPIHTFEVIIAGDERKARSVIRTVTDKLGGAFTVSHTTIIQNGSTEPGLIVSTLPFFLHEGVAFKRKLSQFDAVVKALKEAAAVDVVWSRTLQGGGSIAFNDKK